MKKNIVLFYALILFSSVASNAQTICDSISISAAYVDVTSINITVYNSSAHFIVYPTFTAVLNANPYIVLTDTINIPSFLSISTDANMGYTSAMFLGNISPEVNVPVNSLFTGTLTIQDPNDPTFICSKPFFFQYGMALSSIEAINADMLKVYPNPSQGQFTIELPLDNAQILVTDMLGQQILKTQTTQKTTNLQLENNGVYIVYIATKQGVMIQRLIVNK